MKTRLTKRLAGSNRSVLKSIYQFRRKVYSDFGNRMALLMLTTYTLGCIFKSGKWIMVLTG